LLFAEATSASGALHIRGAMMTDWELGDFEREANKLTIEVLEHGGDLRPALTDSFSRALRQHPDEEDRLLELWDKLTSRLVL
jgi:hypothetical protein